MNASPFLLFKLVFVPVAVTACVILFFIKAGTAALKQVLPHGIAPVGISRICGRRYYNNEDNQQKSQRPSERLVSLPGLLLLPLRLLYGGHGGYSPCPGGPFLTRIIERLA